MLEPNSQSVLITGASTGIGEACAQRLAETGWRVFAGVREPGTAPAAPSDNGTGQIHEVDLDVTSEGSIATALELVQRETGNLLDGLVNNAGIPGAGPVETVPIEDVREVVETNLIGQFAVTQAFLPPIRRARGRIVFMSSLGGRVAFPYASTYHATKWGLEGLAESLRAEMTPFEVAVALVEPAAMETEIWSKGREHLDSVREQMTTEQLAIYGEALASFDEKLKTADESSSDADEVAGKVLDALCDDSPSERYLVGQGARTMTLLRPLLPAAVFDRLSQRVLGS